MEENPRELAINILLEIFNGKYSNLALKEALRESRLSRQDRALTTALVNGVLREQSYIDFVISSRSKTPLNKIKPFVLAVLRTAL
ncbi:MAG: 16S rRNA (cytosine(967)-C(5))-methyltransferase RsmB, partial [Firmicutes bacterium]|nr:16S rRNA (cytosine(967)-C(5))-methyltransferase RsmB [Bacillota bacterium]